MKSFKKSLIMIGICLLATEANAFHLPVMDRMNHELAGHGTFEPVQHNVSGNFEITQQGSNLVLELSEDFQSDMGPDLRITLGDSGNSSPMIVVAQLKMNQGKQRYILPILENDLKRYNTVSIYCLKYSVTFGMAHIVAD